MTSQGLLRSKEHIPRYREKSLLTQNRFKYRITERPKPKYWRSILRDRNAEFDRKRCYHCGNTLRIISGVKYCVNCQRIPKEQ